MKKNNNKKYAFGNSNYRKMNVESAFAANSVGAHINKILVENHEADYAGTSFTQVVKKSSDLFQALVDMDMPAGDHTIINPYTKKSTKTVGWIALVHFVLNRFHVAEFSHEDILVMDFLKTAVLLANKEIYFDYFD